MKDLQKSLSTTGDVSKRNNIPSVELQEMIGVLLPFKKTFEAQSGLSLLLSPDLTILAITDSLLKEIYRSRREIVGGYLFDVFPDNPDAPQASATSNMKASMEKVLATGLPHKIDFQQYDIRDPENPASFIERYWSTITIPILNDDGSTAYILHETVNITEEVKAKQQLQESKEREQTAVAHAEQQRLRLKRLFDHAPAGLAIVEGPDLVFKEVNDTYQQLFPGREFLGLPLTEALPELLHHPAGDAVRKVYETGETYEGKEVLIPMVRYKDQPEDLYWNFINQAIYDPQGNISGILLFALDVTEFVEARRQVEKGSEAVQALNQELEERVKQRTKELQHAEAEADRQSKRLKDLFMHAPAAICILDGPELVYELVNPVYEQLFPGRTLLGKPILEVLPEIKDNPVYKHFREVYETGKTHEESELLIPFIRPEDGALENRYFRFIQQARCNEQEQIDGIIVFALEVTEQVAARKAVETSEQQLRLVTNALPVLIGYLDKEEKYRFANKAYEHWFPLKSEDLIGRYLRDIIGEEAYRNVKEYIEQGFAGQAVSFEARMPYRADFVKHIQTNYVPDLKDGVVQGFYTLVTDVTDQVLIREALEESEQKANIIAEKLAIANQSLKIANKELGNYNTELEQRVAERTAALLETNRLLKDQIEENKRAEDSLSKSHRQLQALTKHLQEMREEERKYIARELHDELGQSFTALKIDVALLLKKLKGGKIDQAFLSKELQSMMKTINGAITSVREIVATLRPAVLDNFGLLSEIESQAQDFQKRTSVAVDVITDLEYIPLEQETSIEVFRIIQESMTNIARHAAATFATITIDETAEGFNFTVADNGKGIKAENLSEIRTFGLLGMQERAERIGATLAIDTKPYSGTRITLEVPSTVTPQ
ncbi:PAS domain-containing protein [Pontibacter sp. KCTC 32443]|uniref:PAS domain-containing protein n=1 Tax=Pontibacter TaxID=323449 RepID=UPI00164D20C7|nr:MULTISPECIES: PAS domain-containing protein [Pontibacter]MBC5772710.1 PAS domain-containing protein [Pontibacter sp. KCTC 32443]